MVRFVEVDAESEINILVPAGLFSGFIRQLTPPLYRYSWAEKPDWRPMMAGKYSILIFYH